MNDTARQLRAQIPTSTDPDWLERMARHAEGLASAHEVPAPAPLRAANTAPDLSDPVSNLTVAVNTPGSTRR
ncbi:MAG: hypothetical protein E6G95_17385 [Alphaproteobacteria bacterium]|nr:MAG: hypothetical protein E6G95_17385 [Alphaproteobacteria bacterium]